MRPYSVMVLLDICNDNITTFCLLLENLKGKGVCYVLAGPV